MPLRAVILVDYPRHVLCLIRRLHQTHQAVNETVNHRSAPIKIIILHEIVIEVGVELLSGEELFT